MRYSAIVFASLLAALLGFALLTPAATTRSPSKSKSTGKAAAKKAPAKAKSVKSTAARLSKSKSTKKTPAVTWRTRQQAPTPDRYKEIQQALVDKGYLKSEPSGVWDADSSAAMQRFQMDHQLGATGKITAPALIGLGLGGKSAGAPEEKPLAPAPTPAPR